jgi:hypothetical protein
VKSNLCLINSENYSVGSSFSRSIYHKGGVCTFVRKDICYSSLDLSQYCKENIIEICAIQLKVKEKYLIIIRIYREPPGNFCEFLRLLDITLKYLYKPNTEFLLCGDFKVDCLSSSDRQQALSLLLSTCNMVNFSQDYKTILVQP